MSTPNLGDKYRKCYFKYVTVRVSPKWPANKTHLV